MIEVKDSFTVNRPLQDVWSFLQQFDVFASCIPTLKRFTLIDENTAEGVVGVTLGHIPVESKVLLKVTERKPPCCVKAEGVSYLGETIVHQLPHGQETTFTSDSVGKIYFHLDLREGENGETAIHYTAGVEAHGRLKKIYEAIMRTKASALQKEFAQKLQAALNLQKTQV